MAKLVLRRRELRQKTSKRRDRQHCQKPQLLIPVALDSYVFDGWRPKREDLAVQIRSRVVADFRTATDNEDEFEIQFARLVEALAKT